MVTDVAVAVVVMPLTSLAHLSFSSMSVLFTVQDMLEGRMREKGLT